MRAREKMDTAQVAGALPAAPSIQVQAYVHRNHNQDLGGHLLIYSRVSYAPGDEDFLGWPGMDDRHSEARHWAARCQCTNCGYAWRAGYLDGRPDGMRGISVIEGPDGTIYDGVPDEHGDNIQHYVVGVGLVCPDCDAVLTVTPKSALKNGRLYQIMTATVERVGQYAAVCFWMHARRFGPDGTEADSVTPFRAAVLSRGGKMRYFMWTRAGKWVSCAGDIVDPEQYVYHSYDGAMGRKMGCVVFTPPEDLTGTTGEKTGLAEYVRAGGQYPIMYLAAWRATPHIENLIKCGWAHAIISAINEEVCRATSGGGRVSVTTGPTDELPVLADWTAGAAPRQMLHMTRAEVRRGAAWQWDAQTLMLWQAYCAPVEGGPIFGPGDAAEFNRLVNAYGVDCLKRFADPDGHGLRPEDTLYVIDKYLQRQCRLCDMQPGPAMTAFFDYRDMLWAQRDAPTQDELFPNNLRAAHDALAAAEDALKNNALDKRFAEIAEKWRGLEYSDGELCVVLPRSNSDLVREGQKLRHCVGGYGRQHVSGKIILFVRHARRPERSWYTLNEDLTGFTPQRVQLHGYRNEWAHGRRLYIPERVQKFVELWEKNILLPAFAADRENGRRVRVTC